MSVSRIPELNVVVEPDLDDHGWQSFPASDPPSTWWGGTGDSIR